MDLIDKHNTKDVVNDAIAEYIPLLEGKCIEIPLAIARAIMNMPSAEPDVIRCKDCKHHDGIRCFRWNSTIITGFDDYCSNAERRSEEE